MVTNLLNNKNNSLNNHQELLNVTGLKSTPENETKRFELLVILKKVTTRVAKTGTEFLSVECGDKTGHFAFNIFENAHFFRRMKESKPGEIIKLQGQTEFYQGKFSPRIQDIEWLSEEEVLQNDYKLGLIECSTEDVGELWADLTYAIAMIKHERLRQTVEIALAEVGDAFKYGSAAISMHHAYRSGLLEHTVHMCRAANVLLPLYPEVNPDLAMAGIILHDIGKVIEYAGELSTYKTKTGLLQGHVVLGYRIVRKAGMQAKLEAEWLERLEHIILSHQGELEWGAAVMASTPEAVFVSKVDDLDAKMGVVQQALRHSNKEEEFSQYLPALKSNLLLKPIEEE